MAVMTLLISSFYAVTTYAQQTIKPGSVLNITVLGSEELSHTVTVAEDGTTDYPVLGSFDVAGMTVDELTDLLMSVLSRLVDRPRVFVTLSDFRLVTARVKGAVIAPGEVVLKQPADVLDAIAEAGGPTDEADLRRVMIVSERNAIDGDDPARRVERIIDLVSYSKMNAEDYHPIAVQFGDLIVVPTLEPNSFVRVLGEVRLPGPYVPEEDATIVDVIYQAGGPTSEADMGEVVHIRRSGENTEETEYDINELLSKQAGALPRVRPGDIIVVASKQLYEDFGFWVGLARDLAVLASSIVLVSRL